MRYCWIYRRGTGGPDSLAGLKKLEYRGYDSAGLAVRDEATGKIEVVKAKGRLHVLEEKTDGGRSVPGSLRNRAYPLGDPRRAVGNQCPSPLQR